MSEVTTSGFEWILQATALDVAQALPELDHYELFKDVQLIIERTESRGLGVILKDLPELGKVFDKGLSSGFFDKKKLPHTMIRRGGKVIFHHLINECFDSTGAVLHDVDPNVVLYIRQLCLMFKKFSIECPDQATRDAVKDFIDIEHSLYMPSNSESWRVADFSSEESTYRTVSFLDLDHRPKLSNPQLDVTNPGEERGSVYQMLGMLQQVCDHVMVMYPELDIFSLVPKHGRGAVSDLPTGEYKYRFPAWPSRLNRVFPWEYFTSHVGDLEVRPDSERPKGDEPLGRLIAVPKTYKGPRLITVEPTAHQFCQQALMGYIRGKMPRVLRHCINFKDQTPSQRWALLASMTGDLATVDLSSASDRLSCWTVERAFRKHPRLLDALAACRTRYILQDAADMTHEGEAYRADYIPLKKFSGQGSAVTFPIQSIIYAMVCLTVVIYHETGWVSPKTIKRAARSIRVFGDDLIVPTTVVPDLASLLGAIQLKVNVQKTHWSGHFRESCGMDAYAGYDVTPTYVTSQKPEYTPDSLQSWIDTSNNAFLAGWWRLAQVMDNILDVELGIADRIPISRYNLECMSLRTYVDGTSACKWRVNKRLMRDEVQGLYVHTSTTVEQDRSLNALLQYFLEKCPHLRREDVMPLLDLTRRSQGVSGHVVGNRDRLRSRWVRAY
jgi:hypothetical protein